MIFSANQNARTVVRAFFCLEHGFILELDQNLSKGFDRAKPVKFCMRRRSVPSHDARVRSTRVSRGKDCIEKQDYRL